MITDFLQVVTYASIGGVIPCLIWLVFWLREVDEHPEPPFLILACFVAGMITTLVVLPFEYVASLSLPNESIATFAAWSFIEEIGKFAACWFVALRLHKDHSPIDIVIYMLTVALGFAALENTLYLITPLSNGDTLGTAITGNLRFIGSALLHTLTSASVGVFLAFAYFKKPHQKQEYAIVGLLFAGVLHTLFNLFILEGSGVQAFMTFASVWLLIISLIVVLEKVKVIHNINT